MLDGMKKRKKPTWTEAMRQRAAEHGAHGGATAWVSQTPEGQAAIRELLRMYAGRRRGTGANRSPAAREAQRARAIEGMKYLSAKKARKLLELGILKTGPVEAPPLLLVASPAISTLAPVPHSPIPPNRDDYSGEIAFAVAMHAWAVAERRP